MLRKFIPMIIFALLLTTVAQTGVTEVEASKKDDVISISKKYIGTPYVYGGTTPNGFDCSGYIRYVMNQVGVSLPRTVAQMNQQGTPVAKSNLQVGDLVFFKTVTSGPSHAGIYIGNSQFIHASTSRGVMISSINDPYYWGPRYLGAKRVMAADKVEAAVKQEEPKRQLGQGEYYDVDPKHWAFNEIKELSNSKIISGSGNDQFAPDEKVTRAQLAVFIARATGLKTPTGVNGFTDVPTDHWAAGAISAADRAGHFSYIDGETFGINTVVTREEIAFIFAQAFELDVPDIQASSSSFADVSQSNWAYGEIQALKENGIINGFSDGTYRPGDNITRAEFAKALHTAMK